MSSNAELQCSIQSPLTMSPPTVPEPPGGPPIVHSGEQRVAITSKHANREGKQSRFARLLKRPGKTVILDCPDVPTRWRNNHDPLRSGFLVTPPATVTLKWTSAPTSNAFHNLDNFDWSIFKSPVPNKPVMARPLGKRESNQRRLLFAQSPSPKTSRTTARPSVTNAKLTASMCIVPVITVRGPGARSSCAMTTTAQSNSASAEWRRRKEDPSGPAPMLYRCSTTVKTRTTTTTGHSPNFPDECLQVATTRHKKTEPDRRAQQAPSNDSSNLPSMVQGQGKNLSPSGNAVSKSKPGCEASTTNGCHPPSVAQGQALRLLTITTAARKTNFDCGRGQTSADMPDSASVQGEKLLMADPMNQRGGRHTERDEGKLTVSEGIWGRMTSAIGELCDWCCHRCTDSAWSRQAMSLRV
ncbi:hypothetical protein VTI74DRAFT_10344 [Chaetomium olivicolor]